MDPIEKLNRFTRRDFTEDEVYLFDVTLCDNDIDRDLEAFSDEALSEMQALFVGKTGISDHDMKSGSQTARIYDTELVRDASKTTRDGRPYISLKANAYMVRTGSNDDLIREIEGGIKKEVSVSCSAGRRFCSVCGADRSESACAHVPGRQYADKLCYTVLGDIRDAYEWSFVAVPAQVNAGVTKHYQTKEDAAMEQNNVMQEVEKMLRAEVLTLCGKDCIESQAMRLAAEKMDISELMTMKRALLERRNGEAVVQLAGGGHTDTLDEFVQR